MTSDLQKHNNVMGMSNIRMTSPYHAQAGPRQYHFQDKFGNFEYAWKNQDSEKMEKGNDVSVRGRYAYIMSDGVLRRVEYIADNNGFHILRDNADGGLNTYRSDIKGQSSTLSYTPAQHAAKWGKSSADAEAKPYWNLGYGGWGFGS